MKTNLAKNTIMLTIGTVISKGLLFIMIPFFSSWLTTDEYGLYDVICTYVSLLIPFLNLSTGEGMFRYSLDERSEKQKGYISSGLFIAIGNYIIFAAVFTVLGLFVNVHYMGAFLLLLLGNLMDAYLAAYLRATKNLGIYSISSTISVLLIAVNVTFFVKFLGLGVNGILIGYALGYMIGDGLVLIVSKFHRYFSLRSIKRGNIKQLITYSYPLILNNVSWWIMNVSDRTLIIYNVGTAANGIYAIACKIPTLCTAIFSMFNVSWQQTASELIDSEAIEGYFNQVYNRMLRTLLSICAGIVSCNYFLFQYIFDVKYLSGYQYVAILVTAAMLLSLSQFYGGVQIALKEPKYVGRTTAIGAMVNIVLNLLFIPQFGLMAAAITTLIGNATILIIRKMHIKKSFKIRIGKMEKIYIALFVYFAIASFNIGVAWYAILNLLAATIFFCVLNKNYLVKIYSKLNRKKK